MLEDELVSEAMPRPRKIMIGSFDEATKDEAAN